MATVSEVAAAPSASFAAVSELAAAPSVFGIGLRLLHANRFYI